MIWVTIGDLLTFAPNIGVHIHREALSASPERVFEAIKTAFAHMEDELLLDACYGGAGPLGNKGEVSYESYLRLLEVDRIREAGRVAKRVHTKRRRSEFGSRRSAIALALLDCGTPYVCAAIDCDAHVELTIDHKVPLSRGGTDDLGNLQFLCQSHNSKKGDRRGA